MKGHKVPGIQMSKSQRSTLCLVPIANDPVLDAQRFARRVDLKLSILITHDLLYEGGKVRFLIPFRV